MDGRAWGVYLLNVEAPLRVGVLYRAPDGQISFEVAADYIGLGPNRPVLSMSWTKLGDEEETAKRLRATDDKRALKGYLPPWFSNLLPEGALRELVERELGTGHHEEVIILERLGRDLPGAVMVIPETHEPQDMPQADHLAIDAEKIAKAIRFSLAGVHIKFSMYKDRKKGGRLTMPASFGGGNVIAKLPHRDWPRLPELEYAAMILAKHAGVDIPHCDLIDIQTVEGLPDGFTSHGDKVFICDRFDRNGNARVHVEDFSQILGAVGDRKYFVGNYETIINIGNKMTVDPLGAMLEIVRRVTVNILIGNSDAHLKNWALLYREPTFPIMAPAYDIVPTILLNGDTKMALALHGAKEMTTIDPNKLARTEKWVGAEGKLSSHMAMTVDRAFQTWPKILKELPLTKDELSKFKNWWKSLELTGHRSIV